MNWEVRMNDNPVSRRDVLKIGAAASLTAMAGKILAVEPAKAKMNMETEKHVGSSSTFADAFEHGQYTLPSLPYGYDALEPIYDARTLKIHHGKHHAAAVKGLNDALFTARQCPQG